MGRNNQPRRGFSRERGIDTREIAIRFLIISEDTKSSTEYFKALIKEVQAACSGSEVVSIAKDSVVQGCGMSTTRLLEEAKSIRSKRQIPFDRCWLVFDKDDFKDFNQAIKEATDAGFNVAWSNESFELWYLLHFRYQNTAIPRDRCTAALEAEIQKCKPDFKYDKGSSSIHSILAEHGDQGQAIKNAEKLRNSYRDTNYSSHNPCTHVDELIKEITDRKEREKILKGEIVTAPVEHTPLYPEAVELLPQDYVPALIKAGYTTYTDVAIKAYAQSLGNGESLNSATNNPFEYQRQRATLLEKLKEAVEKFDLNRTYYLRSQFHTNVYDFTRSGYPAYHSIGYIPNHVGIPAEESITLYPTTKKSVYFVGVPADRAETFEKRAGSLGSPLHVVYGKTYIRLLPAQDYVEDGSHLYNVQVDYLGLDLYEYPHCAYYHLGSGKAE